MPGEEVALSPRADEPERICQDCSRTSTGLRFEQSCKTDLPQDPMWLRVRLWELATGALEIVSRGPDGIFGSGDDLV